MVETEYNKLLDSISHVAVQVAEVKGDVKVIKQDVMARPCAMHAEKLNANSEKIREIEMARLQDNAEKRLGAREFWVRLLATAIPMIPIAIGIWQLLGRKPE